MIKTNKYGNIDIRNGIPNGCSHIKSAGPYICKLLGVEYVNAIDGFKKTIDGKWEARKCGVVVNEKDGKAVELKAKSCSDKFYDKRVKSDLLLDFARRIKKEYPAITDNDIELCSSFAVKNGNHNLTRTKATIDDKVVFYVREYLKSKGIHADEARAILKDWAGHS